MLQFLRKRRWWVILSVLVVVGLVAGGLYLRQTKAAAASADATQIQTATARLGSLVLSASGSGVVIASSQTDLAFTSSGTLLELLVSVGDRVEAGQLLARIDETNAQAQFEQADITLRELTSATAVATARQAVGEAQTAVDDAHDHLAYLISPTVLKWEERVAAAQAAVDAAEAAAQGNPSAEAAAAFETAQATLTHAQGSLLYAQSDQSDYLQDQFTFRMQRNRVWVDVYSPPTAAEVEAGRAALQLSQATLQEAQWLYAELTGAKVPEPATGSKLAQVQQARITDEEAQRNLEGCRLVAPTAGTVTSIVAGVGESMGTGTFITLVDMQHVSLDVYLDETDMDKAQVGNKIVATFDALPDQVFDGHIASVDPTLNSGGGVSTIHALAQFDTLAESASPLLLGMNASVEVIAGSVENAVLVPVEALRELAPGSYAVFVIENGTPKLRPVTVGLQDVTFAQITSGLQAGEVVSTGIVVTQ
jgi:HlyD family secretion protein